MEFLKVLARTKSYETEGLIDVAYRVSVSVNRQELFTIMNILKKAAVNDNNYDNVVGYIHLVEKIDYALKKADDEAHKMEEKEGVEKC